jgi:hypothetical protein
MGPRAGVDALSKRKKSLSCRESNAVRPTRCLGTVLTELSRLIVLRGYKSKVLRKWSDLWEINSLGVRGNYVMRIFTWGSAVKWKNFKIGRWEIRRPFEKFVESPYYSESELCGGAVTVCFSKYLPWQLMNFLRRSTYFSKTCCRQFAASFKKSRSDQEVETSWSLRNFLPRSSLFTVGKAQKSHGAWSGPCGGCSNGIPLIHFFRAEWRIRSCNADAPVRKYIVAPPS